MRVHGWYPPLSLSTIVAAVSFCSVRPAVSSVAFPCRPAAPVFCFGSGSGFGSAPSRRVCVVFRSTLSRRVVSAFSHRVLVLLCFRAVPPRPDFLKREKPFCRRLDVNDNG